MTHVLRPLPLARSAAILNPFGLVIASISAPGVDAQLAGATTPLLASHTSDADAAVRFGVTADTFERMGWGRLHACAVRPSCSGGALLQVALWPLVVNVVLSSGEPHDIDAALKLLRSELPVALEGVRAAAEAHS